MSTPSIIVAGSGSLARNLCWSLAAGTDVPMTVRVLARNKDKAAEVAGIAAIRARLSGSAARFEVSTEDTEDVSGIDAEVARTRPRLLVNCASYQSPWERMTAPSAWSELVRRGGFGLTLPLQASLAVELAGAVARRSPDTLVVNACFPDVVNQVVAALGLPVFCGIGNVMSLAAALAPTVSQERPLRVLAHHVHLTAPSNPADEALAWLGDRPITDVGARLAAFRTFDRKELNAVTGHAAASLVTGLLSGEYLRISVPGPFGLPGGYPVAITSGGRLTLDLPTGITEADAVRRNRLDGLRDGVVLDGTDVVFSPAVREALEPLAPEIAAGFPVTELDSARDRLLLLRERLRAPGAST
ncbi:hypothetical protein [Allokutzneria oryzae]|uniref:Saccharopine dehydrogenase NADP binding domain-containing protein n=1 Tax=Allokutzneria oryzae TaxID=1378989 RepID=A0ABV5ZTX1_9PSEU